MLMFVTHMYKDQKVRSKVVNNCAVAFRTRPDFCKA